ncbi:MAG: citrate lyase holo-[acyl-carrier protein] synthase [Propionibacteriaceae bacterium]
MSISNNPVQCGSATLEQVLARREARRDRQRALLERGMPLVSLTMVTPGAIKNSTWIRQVFKVAVMEIVVRIRELEEWPIWVYEELDEITGPELLLAVDGDPVSVKKAMIDIEDNHPWGRLFDIDVVDEDAAGDIRVLTRSILQEPARRCLICQEPAAACARSQTHTLAELSDAIVGILASSQ